MDMLGQQSGLGRWRGLEEKLGEGLGIPSGLITLPMSTIGATSAPSLSPYWGLP